MNKFLSVVVGFAAMSAVGTVLAGGSDHMLPACAPAAQHYYVGITGGYSLPRGDAKYDGNKSSVSEDVKDGYDVGVHLGYTMTDLPLSLEAAANYYNYKVKDVAELTVGHIEMLTLMANALYHFDLGGSFTPYIGAGIGYARFIIQESIPGGDGFAGFGNSSFAYQALAGVDYQVSRNVDLGLQYRFMKHLAKIGLEGQDIDFSDAMFHSIDLHLCYRFG